MLQNTGNKSQHANKFHAVIIILNYRITELQNYKE